LHRKFKKREYS